MAGQRYTLADHLVIAAVKLGAVCVPVVVIGVVSAMAPGSPW